MNIHTDEGIDFIKSTLEIVRNVHPAFDNFLELGSPRNKSFKMLKKFAGENISALLHSLETISSGDWEQIMASGINIFPMSEYI